MAEQFLKFTGLTHDEILSQIRDKINADTRFDNPRESAIFQTMIEIFAGSTDITNYYLQRRAEECYFDTAQLKSSIILLARQLGYVVTRPEPAKGKLKIILEGDFTGVFDSTPGADNKIQIPYYSKFTTDGKNYVLINTFTYNIISDVLTRIDNEVGEFKLEIIKDSFGNDIEIAQGEIKEKVIIGNNNRQVGSNFQIYKIEDTEFSNIYGDKDYFHNDITRIYVGNKKDSTTLYSIDRRSLINWESLDTNVLSASSKICVVRTTPDEVVEVLFGDGGFASKGALTKEDNIYVQYLATKGADANVVGVIGNIVNHSGKVYTNTGIEITDKVSFEMQSNITGGADIEENNSIKFSAPKIYYSLDRVVSKDDYINYLKTLKTPIDVKNAIAWGEQEERDKAGIFADMKMFNVSFFSVVASLYNLEGDIYSVKTSETGLDNAVLDLNYDPDEIQTQSYFNVYTRQGQANQLKFYDVTSYYKNINGSELDTTQKNVTYFGNKYDVNARLNFWYQTDITNNASNIILSGTVSADFSSLTSASSDMSTIATLLDIQIRSFLDVRANSSDNENYQQSAFDNNDDAMITWDGTNERYDVVFGTNSPCYTTTFFGDLATELGLANRDTFDVAVTDKGEISGRIVEVVDNLNTRAQMNIKNIYISPIIHNFNLDGTVYVKALYDKETLRTEINNSIYKWLDLNVDYTRPIRKSNITELIEKHAGIINVNANLVPDDITNGVNNTTNKYYLGWNDALLKPYGSVITNIMGINMLTYMTGSSFDEINEVRKFYNTFVFKWPFTIGGQTIILDFPIQSEHILEEKIYNLNNSINERSFFNTYVKSVYDVFLERAEKQLDPINMSEINNYQYVDKQGNLIPNYRRFIGYSETRSGFNTFNRYFLITSTSDFVKVIGKIHKDLSYIIKLNMLDSHGNIEDEYDINRQYVRGGYSLGSEIVKVSLATLNYEYK